MIYNKSIIWGASKKDGMKLGVNWICIWLHLWTSTWRWLESWGSPENSYETQSPGGSIRGGVYPAVMKSCLYSHEWTSALQKDWREPAYTFWVLPSLLPSENIAIYKEWILMRHCTFQDVDLGLPNLQNCEKPLSIAYRLSHLWGFGRAAQTD